MRFLTNVVADILTHIYTNEFHNAQLYIHPCVIIKMMTACYLKDYIHVKYLDGEILGYIRGFWEKVEQYMIIHPKFQDQLLNHNVSI